MSTQTKWRENRIEHGNGAKVSKRHLESKRNGVGSCKDRELDGILYCGHKLVRHTKIYNVGHGWCRKQRRYTVCVSANTVFWASFYLSFGCHESCTAEDRM